MNILEELYFGNVKPVAKRYEEDSSYAEQMKIIVSSQKKLNSSFSDDTEKMDLLSQLVDAQVEILAFGERESFIEGFQLGARFMLDTFLLPGKSVLRDIK